jgi:hypothetical protein
MWRLITFLLIYQLLDNFVNKYFDHQNKINQVNQEHKVNNINKDFLNKINVYKYDIISNIYDASLKNETRLRFPPNIYFVGYYIQDKKCNMLENMLDEYNEYLHNLIVTDLLVKYIEEDGLCFYEINW